METSRGSPVSGLAGWPAVGGRRRNGGACKQNLGPGMLLTQAQMAKQFVYINSVSQAKRPPGRFT